MSKKDTLLKKHPKVLGWQPEGYYAWADATYQPKTNKLQTLKP